jgi:4-amino-4-deoxy-L-arabinose transferase-like glycosyltransferase
MNSIKAMRFSLENFGAILERGIAWIVAWILLPVTFYALDIAPKDYPAWVFALVGIGLIWLLKSRCNPLMTISSRRFFPLIIVLFVVLRVVWIYYIPTVPFSDFATYNNLAGILSKFKPFTHLDWRSLNETAWGYPVFLSLWFAIVGNDLLLAKLLNILLGVATLIVFYQFALFFGERVGRVATFFFVIWPAQIMYTSVLASEHLGMFALLSALLFIKKASYDERKCIWYSALAGLFTGIAYVTRTALVYLIIVAILYILLTPLYFRQKIAHLILITSTFIITLLGFITYMKTIYHVMPIAKSLATLVVGTNFDSTGGWNEKDIREFSKFNSVQEANAYAIKIAKRRIFNNPDKFFLLVTRKILKLWGDEQYGFEWSTIKLAHKPSFNSVKIVFIYLRSVSQYFHVFILVFSIIGFVCIGLYKYKDPGILLLLLPILSSVLLHILSGTQARYHFPLAPILFVIAALGITGISLNSPKVEEIIPYQECQE